MKREGCNKRRCPNGATLVMKVYTEAGPIYLGFCRAHLMDGANVLRRIGELPTHDTGDDRAPAKRKTKAKRKR